MYRLGYHISFDDVCITIIFNSFEKEGKIAKESCHNFNRDSFNTKNLN